jgi:hypothetical protein
VRINLASALGQRNRSHGARLPFGEIVGAHRIGHDPSINWPARPAAVKVRLSD